MSDPNSKIGFPHYGQGLGILIASIHLLPIADDDEIGMMGGSAVGSTDDMSGFHK